MSRCTEQKLKTAIGIGLDGWGYLDNVLHLGLRKLCPSIPFEPLCASLPHFSMSTESSVFLWCKMTNIGEPNFRKKCRAFPSQGKMRDWCTIIQKYYWGSIYTKLNADQWSTPLTVVHYPHSLSALIFRCQCRSKSNTPWCTDRKFRSWPPPRLLPRNIIIIPLERWTFLRLAAIKSYKSYKTYNTYINTLMQAVWKMHQRCSQPGSASSAT